MSHALLIDFFSSAGGSFLCLVIYIRVIICAPVNIKFCGLYMLWVLIFSSILCQAVQFLVLLYMPISYM